MAEIGPVVPAITVRAARSEDIEAITALTERFYCEESFDTPPDRLREHAMILIESRTALVLLALIASNPVGFAITTTSFGLEHGWIAELEDLYVCPGARRAGAARGLIEAARGWAQTMGCSEFEVVIDPKGQARHGLAGFYTRLGFVDHGRRLLSHPLGADTAP